MLCLRSRLHILIVRPLFISFMHNELIWSMFACTHCASHFDCITTLSCRRILQWTQKLSRSRSSPCSTFSQFKYSNVLAEDNDNDEKETNVEKDNGNDNVNKRLSRDSEGNSKIQSEFSKVEIVHCFDGVSLGETRVATPTAVEKQLPWKRGEEDGEDGALQQNEFPAWASNKEYLAYHSPSATFLGN